MPGKDIQVVGGAKFATSLIGTGLIDEYLLMIDPVILARGKSVFSKLKNRHFLHLSTAKMLHNGLLTLTYQQLDTVNTEKVLPGKRRIK